MYEENDILNDIEITNAVTTVTEAAVSNAVAHAAKAELEDKEDPPHAYTVKSSMLPLTNGRLAYEGFYNSYVKPYHLWDHATSFPWLAAFPEPSNWHTKRPKLDANGNLQYDANGDILEEYANDYRRLYYPNAHFIADERHRQWEEVILDSGEPEFIALWALNVNRCRWQDKDVEAIIAQDDLWYGRYMSELPALDEEEEGEKSRADECSRVRMLPLSRGRMLYEGFYNAYIKPYYLWSQVTNLPHLPGFPKPSDWETKRDMLDENGEVILNSDGDVEQEWANTIRRLHFPNAAFVSKARFDQYEAAMLETEEPIWLCLWSINVRKCRWKDKDVEAIIAQDEFWHSRYNTDLPLLDEEEDEGDGGQSGILSARGDGGTPPSSPGLASVEA